MGLSRKTLVAAVVPLALFVSAAASGVGPWPGLAGTVVAPSGAVRYTAVRADGSTTVKKIRVGGGVVATSTFEGLFGIPAVTSTGRAGGLSPDGRLLVLSEPTNYNGLRRQSRFLVIATGKLALARTIVLPGEFGFDALSPDRRTLYVIQHAKSDDLVSYVVRAYDLRANRLLAQPIVDKREADESMSGYPVARATSRRGAWVYTLYHRQSGKPFVHALNTVGRAAVCIDLPWQGSTNNIWTARLQLVRGDRELIVRSGTGARMATVDTATFTVH